MKVGVPTEIKTDEYRVALTPAGVRELVEHGHEVFIQEGAGEGSAISDAEYTSQGAKILPDAAAVFAEVDVRYEEFPHTATTTAGRAANLAFRPLTVVPRDESPGQLLQIDCIAYVD